MTDDSVRSSRGRSRASTACVVVAAVALFIAVVAGWASRTLFDSSEFATRSVAMLDSAEVRHALAIQLTDELVAVGPSNLESYRPLLVDAVENVIETDAFRSIFRTAVEEAHQAVFRKHADRAVLELGETLEILAGSTEDANPGLAQALPSEASSVLVDVTPIVGRIDPWRIGERVRWLDDVAAVIAVVASVAAVVLASRRRVVLFRLGLAVAVVGLAVLAVTLVVPNALADRVRDPALVAATRAGAVRFVGDLGAISLWMIAVGVLFTAATTAVGPPHLAHDLGRQGARLRAIVLGDAGPGPQAIAGFAMVAGGWLLVADTDAMVHLLVVVAGAAVAYVGLVAVLVACLGPVLESGLDAGRSHGSRVRWSPRSVVVGAVLVLLVIGLWISGGAAVSAAGNRARVAGEMKCNGYADLCDRRLDQVVFAGSHNSMSSATDPGWLFAEQLTGIPAQLDSGVRALLVKSHYGIPTGVQVGDAELVVTDKAAETANDPEDEAAELGDAAVARAKALQASAPKDATAKHRVYLCHVYCELGATELSRTLRELRHFLEQHPHEVVMLFIGDYVSAADTAAVFDEARLTDRLWTYDTAQPPPTLRQMIDARRNLLVLSEHSQPPPPWYTKGYGIFQDTPFTFATPAQFSCAVNRGPADAPLFEINHFITNASPPSAEEARAVNSKASLTDRISTCRSQRGLFPTIVAVDFASVGDLMSVVAQVNGVGG